jgi:hypothetical protein
MATAFAATEIVPIHSRGGFALQEGVYKLTMPSSYTTNGEAWDLSASFDYVYGIEILGSTKESAAGYTYSYYGADHSSAKGIAAAGGKLAVYWQTDTATAPSVEITGTTDLTSTIEYLYVRVLGRKL